LLLTAEVRFQSQASSCGIYVGQSGIRTHALRVLPISCQYHPTGVPNSSTRPSPTPSVNDSVVQQHNKMTFARLLSSCLRFNF